MRPLPYEPGVPEADVTRKHVLHTDEQVRSLISIAGGKLTTHRSLAEQAVDAAFGILGRKSPACLTASQPLPGGRTGDWGRFADGFRQACGLPADIADHLLDVYGSRAHDVLGYAGEDKRLRARLPGTSALAAEVPFGFRAEQASTSPLRRQTSSSNS